MSERFVNLATDLLIVLGGGSGLLLVVGIAKCWHDFIEAGNLLDALLEEARKAPPTVVK